ncbi:MAG: hypothetical protein ACRBF0_15020 [Calditrichia bacterium]
MINYLFSIVSAMAMLSLRRSAPCSQFTVYSCLLLCLFLTSCGAFKSSPEVELQETDRLAVLPFVVRGDGLSAALGHIAADRLTAGLINSKHLPVVDRSFVNDAMKQQEISNSYFLSLEAATYLADTLQAKILVLGILDNSSSFKDLDKLQHRLRITVRFLEVASGKLLLLREHDIKAASDIKQVMQKGIDKLLSGLTIKISKSEVSIPDDSLSTPERMPDEQPPTAVK